MLERPTYPYKQLSLRTLLFLDEGPLEDIKAIQNEKTVFKKGKKVE